MIETFTALLFAHALADFLFQTNWINANKHRPHVMLLHGAIVLVTAQAAIGRPDAPELLALAAAHLVIVSHRPTRSSNGVLDPVRHRARARSPRARLAPSTRPQPATQPPSQPPSSSQRGGGGGAATAYYRYLPDLAP